jgi:formylglycine-generating enzyme required for sulfatase activity
VGIFPQGASPYGALDMSGNVWEWCLNEYESGDMNARSTARRGVRGGSWNFDRDGARAAYRGNGSPVARFGYLGFRVVVAVPVSH